MVKACSIKTVLTLIYHDVIYDVLFLPPRLIRQPGSLMITHGILFFCLLIFLPRSEPVEAWWYE